MISGRRGFTLLELLIAVAIIALFAAVVLAFLSIARGRGNDQGVRSALIEARTQAELFFLANGNRYSVTLNDTTTNVCHPDANVNGVKGVYPLLLNAASAAGIAPGNISVHVTGSGSGGANGKITCHACPAGISSGSCGINTGNANAWAVEVPLRTGGFWCMDSHGFNGRNTTSQLAAGDTRCGF